MQSTEIAATVTKKTPMSETDEIEPEDLLSRGSGLQACFGKLQGASSQTDVGCFIKLLDEAAHPDSTVSVNVSVMHALSEQASSEQVLSEQASSEQASCQQGRTALAWSRWVRRTLRELPWGMPPGPRCT